MNIVICDDIEDDAKLLRHLIERYFNDISCNIDLHIFTNGDDLLEDLSSGKLSDVKIAFLDVYMPGINGVEAAKTIRKTNKDMIIIFTTISKTHSLEGFSVYALQYLVKPINYPEVKEALDKCLEKFADSLRFIEVLSDRLTVKIYLKDIMFIEFKAKALYIHTTTETIKTFIPLHELEKQLKGSTFLRTQRSYIINMRHIKRMEANDFVLDDETETAIPIRRDEKITIKQAYRDYLSALTWEM